MTVYFARISEWGPIKIGFCSDADPSRRIGGLQAACPWRLHLIGSVAGGKPDEAWLHESLGDHRMLGEWFSPVPAVVDTINRVLSPTFSWPRSALLDRAIALAGSQTALSNAIGVAPPQISISRKSGMSPRLRNRVEAFLREGVAA